MFIINFYLIKKNIFSLNNYICLRYLYLPNKNNFINNFKNFKTKIIFFYNVKYYVELNKIVILYSRLFQKQFYIVYTCTTKLRSV